jgi:hypothetical protein
MGNNKGRRRRFGAIRQLRSGRYQARYPGPDGLMRTAPRTFDTETDASVWLTVTEAQLIKGEWLDPDAGRVPLGDYAANGSRSGPSLLGPLTGTAGCFGCTSHQPSGGSI